MMMMATEAVDTEVVAATEVAVMYLDLVLGHLDLGQLRVRHYKDNEMKKLIAVILAVGAGSVYAAEIKQVCHTAVVKGKTVQQCKNIKVHKKVAGTPVPKTVPGNKKK